MNIGDKIKKLRVELNFTQDELAKAAGTTKQTIHKYETGIISNIPASKIKSIADKLNTTPAFLMGWTSISYTPDEDKRAFVMLPIVGSVSAGSGLFADDNIIGYEKTFKDNLISGDTYFYLKVKGDSMYPMFMEDDLLLVRSQASVDSGSFGIVRIDGEEGVVKRVEYGSDWVELQSVNPMYSPRKFEGKDVLRLEIVGLVKEVKRKF